MRNIIQRGAEASPSRKSVVTDSVPLTAELSGMSCRRHNIASVIARGAEAVLYREDAMLVKDRIAKGYRLPEIDSRIRRLRTRGEARLLDAAARAGIDVPRVLETSENVLKMEFINGSRVKDVLNGLGEDERKLVCKLIGSAAAKMHGVGIVHGDLTTSNMILKRKPLGSSNECGKKIHGRLYLIDFGLGKFSGKVEDQAVDLYLLYEALKAAHFKYLSCSWQYILKSYSDNYKGAGAVVERLKKIETRRRYKGE